MAKLKNNGTLAAEGGHTTLKDSQLCAIPVSFRSHPNTVYCVNTRTSHFNSVLTLFWCL